MNVNASKSGILRRCAVFRAGFVNYTRGLELQSKARRLVTSGVWDGVLIFLEHKPVITIGRGGGEENLCKSYENLAEEEVDIFVTNRGGNITCHNPGQLVGYPVLNLNSWQQDLHWYVDSLEETIIRALNRLGLTAGRKSSYTGVWLGDEKIAAIGISVRQWVTSHGFALNVNNDLNLFKAIVPCGISKFGVTSLAAVNISTTVSEVISVMREEFCKVFDCSLVDIDKLGDCYEQKSKRTAGLASAKGTSWRGYGQCY